MRQAAHVTHTSLPPTAAACGASTELLTFTSAWRASHVAVVILRRPFHCPRCRATSAGPMSDVWLLMLRLLVGLNAQLHLVTYLRKQVCRWAMAINEHQNSTFNFAHAAAAPATTRGTTERARQREREGARWGNREHVTRTSWQHQHQSKLCQQLNYVICLVDGARTDADAWLT